MTSLLGALRNTVWPQPFRFILEYKEAPSTSGSPVAELIHAHCPHLSGAQTPPYPTRWLPSGHLQTVYSAAGDFSKVDRVEYKRKVFLTPDGGTVALDISTSHTSALLTQRRPRSPRAHAWMLRMYRPWSSCMALREDRTRASTLALRSPQRT